MNVKEFFRYTENLEDSLSFWDKFSSLKFFLFIKLFLLMVGCSWIIDWLNWLKSTLNMPDIIYVVIFCTTFLPILFIGYYRCFTGTFKYSPLRKVFFLKRLAVLAVALMPLDAKIIVSDRKKQFIAETILQLDKLLKKRIAFFISGLTKSGKEFKATYIMTFMPSGAKINSVGGVTTGSGGGDRMFIWEITCSTRLPDCCGELGREKIEVDNMSKAHGSKKSCNNIKQLLYGIKGKKIRGHFSIYNGELFLTVYDDVKKIKLPYKEDFGGKDKTEAVRNIGLVIDILSGEQ